MPLAAAPGSENRSMNFCFKSSSSFCIVRGDEEISSLTNTADLAEEPTLDIVLPRVRFLVGAPDAEDFRERLAGLLEDMIAVVAIAV
mmetsp:Transcript_6289/g.9117  ORF Transcript_6289/g.9117 Transcript_6289/m.9117 type:complete len:87 (-) Transcript_6289:141-401(-)